jgi:pyridoxine 4-dehydrogenase
VRTQVEDALFDMRAEVSPLTYLRLSGDNPAPDNAPAETVPLEESLGALVELREEGKIRHIGLSGASPEMLARAADYAGRRRAESLQLDRPQRHRGTGSL